MTHSHHGHFTLPAKPEKAAEEMIAIISNLQGIYKEETLALEHAQVDVFLGLQAVKQRAVYDYEHGIAQITQRQAEMKTISADTKKKLYDMQAEFRLMAQQNKQLLTRMQRTTERLGQTIRKAAQQALENRAATSYTAKGALDKRKSKNLSAGVSKTA